MLIAMAHREDVLNASAIYASIWAGSDFADFYSEFTHGNLSAVGSHLKELIGPGDGPGAFVPADVGLEGGELWPGGALALEDRVVLAWLQGKRSLFAKRKVHSIPYDQVASVESSSDGGRTITRIHAGETCVIKTLDFDTEDDIRPPGSLLAALVSGEPFPVLDSEQVAAACSRTEATSAVRSMLERRAA